MVRDSDKPGYQANFFFAHLICINKMAVKLSILLLSLNHIIWLRCNQTRKKDKQSAYTTSLMVITYNSDISKAIIAK